jgi:hypothetical protein
MRKIISILISLFCCIILLKAQTPVELNVVGLVPQTHGTHKAPLFAPPTACYDDSCIFVTCAISREVTYELLSEDSTIVASGVLYLASGEESQIPIDDLEIGSYTLYFQYGSISLYGTFLKES